MTTFYILLGLLTLLAGPLRAESLLQPNDHVAICGDSITERRRYSVFMEDYFLMCQPAAELTTTQFGWSGERVPGFLARIDSEVLPFKPTVATTCYGMNDGRYAPMTDETGNTYRQALTASVEKLKAGGVRAIVVGSPGCVDAAAFKNPHGPTTAEEYNKTLDARRVIAQEVAKKEGVAFADVHALMMEANAKAKAAYGDNYKLVAGGGIHPNNNGHLVMAYALLKGLGCDGAIGTITIDLDTNTAQGSAGQKMVSCANGTVQVESTRYPFCFQGDPNTPDQKEACVLKFFPFNDDLNRYLLVVKGLKSAKASVTWGTVTKEFSAADLAKGINLAAEILVNPFSNQFAKINVAVAGSAGAGHYTGKRTCASSRPRRRMPAPILQTEWRRIRSWPTRPQL
jgi:lysophospholipase L1-like esterase